MTRRQQGVFISRRGAVALGAAAFAGIGLTGGALGQERRRVLHVDSYHQGNEWNDRIAAAVTTTLEDAGVEVQVFHMDTKRRSTEADKQAAGESAALIIAEYQPDVVTTSDDNAVKYLIMPHFRDADLPFVFCGVNWDASDYGLPYANTTGMVEVSPIPQILRLAERYAAGGRIGFLAEDTPTKHKEKAHHEKLFGVTYDKAYFVADFQGWVEAFRAAQDEVDVLLLLGVGALTDWDDARAREIAETETRIPTGTDFAWLMPYALLGVGKRPEEQGIWAARAALTILEGVEPSSIPVTHNTNGELLFNPRVAKALGVADPPALARLVE